MKKVIAIAPTSYQLQSLRNFGLEIKHFKNGSHIFEKYFDTEEEAKEYLIERAELYFYDELKLKEAVEEIENYGSVQLDAVKGRIEDVDMKTVFILAFDSGARGIRYIDEDVSMYGTSDEYSAKYFDTKEDAQEFANKNNISGWVSDLEIEA